MAAEPDWRSKPPDARLRVTLLDTESGGRARPIASGYRGAHRVRPEHLTTGELELLDTDCLTPGATATALVRYLTPEVYPQSLWPGKVYALQEGGRVVGEVEVIAVLNPVLHAPST